MKSSNLVVSDVFSSATYRNPLDISSIDRVTMLSSLRGEESFMRENLYAKGIVVGKLTLKRFKSQAVKEP